MLASLPASPFTARQPRGLPRQAGGLALEFEGTLSSFSDPDGCLEVAVVEHLRVRVRADARAAWLQAETRTWEPWLRRQSGFLGRELIWDEEREEGILLIRWASREQWKSIPTEEVDAVQRQFEAVAHRLLSAAENPTPLNAVRRGRHAQPPANPFPLVHAGELDPRALAAA